MNTGAHLSDRMPAVASGRIRWSAIEEQHLAQCDECRGEWALVSAVAWVGREVEASLDLATIEAGVMAGLRAPFARPTAVRWAAWLAPLAVAAGLVLAVWSGSLRDSDQGAAEAAAALLPELETLTSAELQSMLQLLPRAGSTEAGPDGFEDLSESEVSSVLKDLES